MTLFEAYQLALPFLDWMGVDTTNLPRAWHRQPIDVVGGAGFALSASVGLLLLWYLVLRLGALLSTSWDSAGPGIIALRAGGLFFLGFGLLVGTFLLATMRHGMIDDVFGLREAQQGQPAGAGIGQSVFFFLTLIVPFAAAYLHHRMGQSAYWQRRQDTALKQAQWDRDEEERVLAAERLADLRDLRREEREGIEHHRTLLRQKRQALAERVQAAQRGRQAQLKQARLSTEVYARSLLAALEQDRYYFLRFVNRYKAFHLLPDAAGDYAQSPTKPRRFIPALPAGSNGHEF
jgi:hypothetical protein